MSRIQVKGYNVIVPIELLDVNSIKFGNAKPTDNGFGMNVPVRYTYEGEEYMLSVVYPRRVMLFGFSKQEDLQDKSPVKKVTGYNLDISCLKEGDDPVLSKHLELDEFLMKHFYENRKKYGIAMATRETVYGVDKAGSCGIFARTVKYSTKKDKVSGEVTFLDYPPRIRMKLPVETSAVKEGDKVVDYVANFRSGSIGFFTKKDDDSRPQEVQIGPLYGSDPSRNVGPFTKGTEIRVLGSMTRVFVGQKAISMKPTIKQLIGFPSERLNPSECLIDGFDDVPIKKVVKMDLAGGDDTDDESVDQSSDVEPEVERPSPVRKSRRHVEEVEEEDSDEDAIVKVLDDDESVEAEGSDSDAPAEPSPPPKKKSGSGKKVSVNRSKK